MFGILVRPGILLIIAIPCTPVIPGMNGISVLSGIFALIGICVTSAVPRTIGILVMDVWNYWLESMVCRKYLE